MGRAGLRSSRRGGCADCFRSSSGEAGVPSLLFSIGTLAQHLFFQFASTRERKVLYWWYNYKWCRPIKFKNDEAKRVLKRISKWKSSHKITCGSTANDQPFSLRKDLEAITSSVKIKRTKSICLWACGLSYAATGGLSSSSICGMAVASNAGCG